MWHIKGAHAALVLLSIALPANADAPLSAIDWLSKSVSTPTSLQQPAPSALPQAGPLVTEPPVTHGIGQSTITVAPIGVTAYDALGLVPAARAGLPPTFWGDTPSAELAGLLRAEIPDTMPAIRALLYLILIAELDPPVDSDPRGQLFLARIDKLLDLGAVDPAQSLLELLGTPTTEPFRRLFDITLLTGDEDRACELMRRTPNIAPTFPARIFCLARGGDWSAAALSLRTGETLGTIEPAMADLLERFLDPDLFEGEPPLPMPDRPSPLTFRMMEAIAQPIPTSTLPVAFAQSDLRSNSGWKTQIEAAERLARMGAIPPARLYALYTKQKPAASGGVWTRAEGVQKLDTALSARDRARVADLLPGLWKAMESEELEVPFADIFGLRLARAKLDGDAGALAFRIGLLSDDSQAVAQGHRPRDAGERFIAGLALGKGTEGVAPDQMGVAVAAAFAPDARPGEVLGELLSSNQTGAAVLRAMNKVSVGAGGDLRDVTEGLVVLRRAGLETAARRAALELILLERRG